MRLEILTDKRKRAVWSRAFRIWQQTPHKVAPMTDKLHVCQSCSTEFIGNYCPRCGQSQRVGRFSFKMAFLLFLDVWGIGNRGMFHSIRDLILRPGYMIRDYVGGMQSAYFPPFKMFFILTAFFMLLSNGIHFDVEEAQKAHAEKDVFSEIEAEEKEGTDKEIAEAIQFSIQVCRYVKKFEDKYPSIFLFLTLLLASAPLYLFFRRCPLIPDLRYTENLVALTYTANMYTLYMMVESLLPSGADHLIKLAALFMILVALKQFTGYSKWRLFFYIHITLIFLFILLVGSIIATASIYYIIFQQV